MPSSTKRLYWDSCVFVTLLSKVVGDKKLAQQQDCRRYLQDAIKGELEVFTSTFSIAEVCKTEESVGDIPDAVKGTIRSLFNEPYVQLVSVDLARAEEARELIWEHNWLSPQDAIQIACALHAKIQEMHTYDGEGKKKGILDLKGKVGTPPLKIVTPHHPGPDRMPGV